jgi:transcriptional regulator with XRE-family HTH domain
MAHLGTNIARIRGFRGLAQKSIAAGIGLSQQEYSKLEAKAQIEDEMLEKIARQLDVPAELIKAMEAEQSVHTVNQQSGNQGNVFNYQFNPIDRMVELYEKLLHEKEEIISLLKAQLASFQKEHKQDN